MVEPADDAVDRAAADGVLDLLAGLPRVVAAAGVPVSPDRTQGFLAAAAQVGLVDRDALYWAGRATLCGDPDHLRPYDLAFEAWFGGRLARHGAANPYQRPRAGPSTALPDDGARGAGRERPPDEDEDVVRAAASATEQLRHRDVGDLDAAARAQVERLIAALHVRLPQRPSARRRRAHHGDLDVRRTLREELRRAGEPGPLRYRRTVPRPRRVVWLVDVSGSMTPYADVLLRLAHAQAHARHRGPRGGARVEVFTVGTRLTRITPAMAHRDVERALRAAGEQVPDWSGGTRLGETLRAFVDRWGQRGVARSAVVVICSDGWERGDAALLGEQVQRLSRLAHRVVWVNPHRGKDGYRPVQAGIVAVLPHLDDLVAGHSLESYTRLMEVLARA